MVIRQVGMWTIIMVLLCGMIGCSGDDTTTNSNGGGVGGTGSAEIGPAGGTVNITSKVSFDIPAGALADTITFLITTDTSVFPLTGSLGLVSESYSIEPSGTIFNIPATLTINYNPALLGGAGESDIFVLANHNGVTSELPTVVNQSLNMASAEVSSLSSFGATADTAAIILEGIFAKLVVGRAITYIGGQVIQTDMIEASFDSSFAPCVPDQPTGSVSVMCNLFQLVWDDQLMMHTYPDMQQNGLQLPFIILGGNYIYNVPSGESVPPLTDSVVFPSMEPYITSPTFMDTLPRSEGLTISWANSGAGSVELIMMGIAEDSVIYVETDNDGNYTLTPSQTNSLTPGMYFIVLNYYNKHPLLATGYDPRSFIAGRVMSTVMITMN